MTLYLLVVYFSFKNRKTGRFLDLYHVSFSNCCMSSLSPKINCKNLLAPGEREDSFEQASSVCAAGAFKFVLCSELNRVL